MVLVDAVLDLAFPHPAAAELVAVAAFVEEDVTGLEYQLLRSAAIGSNRRNCGEVEEAPLDVRNPQIRVLDVVGVSLALRVLRDAALQVCNLTKCRPGPVGAIKQLRCCRTPEGIKPSLGDSEGSVGGVEAGEVFFDGSDYPLLLGERC